METSELLKKVRRIEIKTRGLSRNIFAGQVKGFEQARFPRPVPFGFQGPWYGVQRGKGISIRR